MCFLRIAMVTILILELYHKIQCFAYFSAPGRDRIAKPYVAVYLCRFHTHIDRNLYYIIFLVTVATNFIKIWLLSNNDFTFSLGTAALLHTR